MAMKFNPSTGRFETVTPIDNPPAGTVVGSLYTDTVTGQRKQKMGYGMDLVVASAPKSKVDLGPFGATGATDSTGVTPTSGVQVTGPRAETGLPTKGSTEKIKYKQEKASTNVNQVVGDAVTKALQSGDIQGAINLINALNGTGGGGSAAARAAQNAANYNALMRASKEQAATATAGVNKATQDYLASLVQPTAYQGLSSTEVPVAQQGLGQALAAYGATGEQAAAQSATDAAVSKQLADLQARSMAQLGEAQKGYQQSLVTSAQGAQAQALQELQRQMMAQQMQAGLKYGVPKKKK